MGARIYTRPDMLSPPADAQPAQITLEKPCRAPHGARLAQITRTKKVMGWVADGNTWGPKKLDRFFAYCGQEEGQSREERENYYSVVAAGGVCVGIVGVHPIAHDPSQLGAPSLTVFISAPFAGRGIGPKAIGAALAEYWGHHPGRDVLIDVRADNIPMQRVAEKMGFGAVEGAYEFGGRAYTRFVARGRR